MNEVIAIRDRSEAWKAYIKDNSKLCPWVTDPGEMTKKTCVKQAYKYWPKTDRLEKAIHYLNTESDEGLKLTSVSDQPATDAALARGWSSQAKAAGTIEALQAVWVSGLEAIKQSKDMAAYEQFKAAVNNRKAELEQALGIRQKLDELMAWSDITEINEAVHDLILTAHALGPTLSYLVIGSPRNKIQIRESVARMFQSECLA
ncbi:recombinase RecT [Pseudomonas sp. B33.4]|uniref:recombinase RecT n=1 Tax=Pseudomonas sp. B33.4 TaxID=3104265 RepID=UPI002ADEA67D|nr:recombinase RecT [Pseudomonas sp. B33.4]